MSHLSDCEISLFDASGSQFHDGCSALCECTKTGVDCAPIDCPTSFGLDILDPNCVDWETLPRDFKPSPPHCCPEKVTCRSNGTCIYANESYPNYSDIPIEVRLQVHLKGGAASCIPPFQAERAKGGIRVVLRANVI